MDIILTEKELTNLNFLVSVQLQICHWTVMLHCYGKFPSECIALLVRERSALSDPYNHFCVCLSVILSATSELNISETRPDSEIVPMDNLYKLAYGLSIVHAHDDVT